ncbi:MAG: hypothetical protein DMG15_06755 [Acidobacteria bacterium]|nr:MAG: hypothetical protein DMG15_06755 [Acidobacteriota bacterium]
MNPGATDATATFTLFGPDGTALKSSTQKIGARGQLARLASELFPATLTAGWVRVASAATGLQGFWFGGDFVNTGDGSEPAASASELVLPMITPVSEIHVANTGSTDVTVMMDLLNGDGLDLDQRFPQLIRANGFFKANVADIFRKADLKQATHMRLKCACAANAFAAVVLARDFIASPSLAVLNALPASTSTQTLVFPHLVDRIQGSTNWKSVISVTNLSATSPNDVTITFTAQNGTVRTVQRTLQPKGSVRETGRDMLGFTTGFQNGWVRVSSASSLPITGFVAYAETVSAGVAVVSPQVDAQTNFLFPQIVDLPPWWTGLALLNANPRGTATVKLYAMNPDGSLIGATEFPLQFGTKVARLLSEWIPATQNRTSDGGFIFVLSDLPLFGVELFFTRNMQVVGNIPTVKIPPGSYVPPTPR